ncbi:DNA polymerase III subunit gamma/tau [Verminephrobacter aporrectodeae]|uniref:DNA polymerase III subunit gamma/tau n=1 Tax=Verminephrobacter aporrectodeae TaxID=1110389 RepID=UPI0022390B20|nr:DNA polymerase III subunit gamma/tau [Verminephrobacter aporrectodeae]MCW5223250.1 DNA polymerase III subunit gamma/tau [Verminephrobacter aporrectodeae subsp. tuberculatae]
MSYLVLARKYRPRNFAEMAGQEHVVQALSNALTRQRLHHAYLFTGTRGVGKTTVARILAKALNCQGPDGQGGITAAPCGLCPACTDIDSGRFVDYTELDAASNRGVDEVQSLLEQAVYKPVQGRFKVFMIDEVHMLTNTAFNAMLKTLEEPPEYLKFVLATTDPQKVPVTVLSRCLQFNLRPMAPETVHAQLVQVLAAEQVPAEPQALRLLSRAARGSMRDALSLADQAIAFGNGQLQEAAVRQMLGAVDHAHVLELIDALARGDGRTVVETSDRLRRDGLSAASTLEDMAAVLQRMAVLQVAPPRSADTADTADAQDPEAAQTARLAALMPADETQLLYSLCLHGRGELGLAPDEYAALTMVLLRLLAFKPGGAAVVEKKNLTQPEAAPPDRAPGEGAAPLPPPPPVPPPAAPACAADSAGVPSPPDSDRPPRTQAAATALPVRSAEHFSSDGKPAQATRAALHAIPVRVMPEPESTPEPAPSRHSPTPEGDVWYAAVQQLVSTRAIEALARELALQSQLVARDGAHWLLRVESESLISQPTARERLREALQAAGHASQISVELGAVADSPARRIAAAAAAARLRAEEIVASDPYVQSLMREHGAKIVPGSVRPE